MLTFLLITGKGFKKNEKNNKYTFAVIGCQEFGGTQWYAAITPKSFFEKEGCMYDGYIKGIPWNDVMEGLYDIETQVPEEIFSKVSEKGYEWSKSLSDFLTGCGNVCWEPDLNTLSKVAIVSPAASDSVKSPGISNKITTELCKEAIVAFIKANPGCVHKEFYFDPADTVSSVANFEFESTLSKNWKRESKAKCVPTASNGYATTRREFNCVPYEDQLRASVFDNGSKIVLVQVQGE